MKLYTPSLGNVEAAVAILGDKWTPLLIHALAQKSVRFCNLQNGAGINPRTLSARLAWLEEQGIIAKTTYPEVPPRCEYGLTQKGRDLLPILKDMAAWSKRYNRK
jgi:DNA-binding HxlR family transcriptional regulator